MLEISPRQKHILMNVVREYIRTARAVSSETLKERFRMDISPATIRIDFSELSDKGYLKKEYISGGRIPTDKAYRLYVNELMKKTPLQIKEDEFYRKFSGVLEKMNDSYTKACRELSKRLAEITSNLVIGFMEESVLWKEGWENLVDLPEFQDIDYFKQFTQLVEEVEDNIESLLDESENEVSIEIFIGEEIPLPKKGEFSLICGRAASKNTTSAFLLAGPERMDFRKNISWLNSLLKTIANEL